jgi:uncharacterized membrane protein
MRLTVLANSLVASVLSLVHAYQLYNRNNFLTKHYYAWGSDLALVGLVANYAAVAADTFSSELGILSSQTPRLITSLSLRKVARGTNGGVTLWGLVAGLMGSLVIVTATMAFIPFLPPGPEGSDGILRLGLQGGITWGLRERQVFAWGMMIWGALGSVLDSLLGGWFQQSVVDVRTGKVVEGEGGKKVLVGSGKETMHYKKRADVKAELLSGEGKESVPKSQVEDKLDEKMGGDREEVNVRPLNKEDEKEGSAEGPSRTVISGLGLLDNNEVNFLMALTMSLGAMGIASWAWGVPMSSLYTFK